MIKDTKSRKMKFLATKLSALQSELKVSKEIHQAASIDVQKMFDDKYFPEVAIQQEKKKEDQPIEEFSEESVNEDQKEKIFDENSMEQLSVEKAASPEVRKMFKKIATQCHPDKLSNLEDGFEKRKNRELYSRAREALENDDILIMADVASELGVEIPEITENQLKKTEQKIIAIKKELNHIESTLVWHWFFTEDTAVKDKILNKLFELMYANNSRP